ncbi:MAG: hypothetical protein ACRENJ_08585 [Candidatus Eiseniibacteriota bacterium]
MRIALVVALYLLASTGRCNAPAPGLPPPEPKPGDSVEIRGRLDEAVDCRVLRAEGGKVYSLSERLPNLRNGARVCILGTIAVVPQCMTTPGIDVTQVRPWSSCR